MKITTMISGLVLTHEIIEREGDDNLLITRIESLGPVMVAENGTLRQITKEDGLYNLAEQLQLVTHNYISKKLKGEINHASS